MDYDKFFTFGYKKPKEDDGLNEARGCLTGIGLGILLWTLIILIVVSIFGCSNLQPSQFVHDILIYKALGGGYNYQQDLANGNQAVRNMNEMLQMQQRQQSIMLQQGCIGCGY